MANIENVLSRKEGEFETPVDGTCNAGIPHSGSVSLYVYPHLEGVKQWMENFSHLNLSYSTGNRTNMH